MAKPNKAKARQPWQDIAREVQNYRDASIDRVQPVISKLPTHLPPNVLDIPSQLLSQEEIQITQTAPEDLLRRLAAGELSATSVTRAFLRRAGLAQMLVCLRFLSIFLPRQRYPDQLPHGTSP